jgi:hypothetical protein
LSDNTDVRQVIKRLETIASHQGCHGPFDENCYEYPERMSEWCAPCIMGAAHKLLTAQPSEVEHGNDKFDEVTWAELVRLREETRYHVELRITTRCPSCGHQSLFIGKGGHLTCSWLECKEPGVERAIKKLTSHPAPSGWQQRIAAAFEAGFCARPKSRESWVAHETNGSPREWEFSHGGSAHDLMPEAWQAWQNAVDALPPAMSWQQRVQEWMLSCFGQRIAEDRLERCDRFCEEAIELLQALGYDRARLDALVNYVYAREVGEARQEVGGVMVTLAALCTAHDIEVDAAREAELARVWTKVEKIREKQKAKPTGSALPVALPLPRLRWNVAIEGTGRA